MRELPENRLFISLYTAALMGGFLVFGALLFSRAGTLYAFLGLMFGGTLGSLVLTVDSALLGSLWGGALAMPLALLLWSAISLYHAFLFLLGGYIAGSLIGYLFPATFTHKRPPEGPPVPGENK